MALECEELFDLNNAYTEQLLRDFDFENETSEDETPQGSPVLQKEGSPNKRARTVQVKKKSHLFAEIGTNGFEAANLLKLYELLPNVETVYSYIADINGVQPCDIQGKVNCITVDAPLGVEHACLYYITDKEGALNLPINKYATDIALVYATRSICSIMEAKKRTIELPVLGKALIWVGSACLMASEWPMYLKEVSNLERPIRFVVCLQDGDCINVKLPCISRLVVDNTISDSLLECMATVIRIRSNNSIHHSMSDLSNYVPDLVCLDPAFRFYLLYFRNDTVTPTRFVSIERFSSMRTDECLMLKTVKKRTCEKKMVK